MHYTFCCNLIGQFDSYKKQGASGTWALRAIYKSVRGATAALYVSGLVRFANEPKFPRFAVLLLSNILHSCIYELAKSLGSVRIAVYSIKT